VSPTNYPGSLDSFTNPTGADDLDDSIGGRTHADMHADINDAMEAVQTALGSPRKYIKDYAEATRTSGDVTLNATAVTAVDTGLDLTIDAASGDVVEFGLTGILSAVIAAVCFDVYTMPSGSMVNPFGAGLSATLATVQGVPGWEVTNLESTASGTTPAASRIQGSITRVLVSGDVSGGSTVLRLYYAKLNTTARLLNATTNIPFKVWAKNYGPV
jgi:hypothetical protein